MKFVKQATYIRYVIANLSKFVQIRMLTSTESFCKGFCENLKESGTSFQATLYVEFFNKKSIFCNIA